MALGLETPALGQPAPQMQTSSALWPLVIWA